MDPNSYDWSFSHMPAAVAKRHGAKVVMGYLSWDTSKNMTSSEVAAHHKLGIGVVLGWESLQGRALGGAANGTQDGQAALAQMKTHVANLGYAPKVPVAVPFAVDQDVATAQLPTILAYLRAAQAVFDADTKTVRLVASAYGEFDLCEYLAAHGIGKGLFQTYAWSNGQVSKHAALYQFLNNQLVEGFGVDDDRVMNAHALAAWWPPNHPLNQPPHRDLLEEIMALNRNSADYKNLVSDIADAVAQRGIPGPDGKIRPAWKYILWTGGYRRMARRLGQKKDASK